MGGAGKTVDLDESGLLINHIRDIDGIERDAVARDGELELIVVAGPYDDHLYNGAARPFERAPDIFAGEPDGALPIDGDDAVARHQPHLFTRPAGDDTQDRQRILIILPFDELVGNPNPFEAAAEVFLDAVHALGVDIDRVGVELFEHPAQRTLGHLRRIDFFDVALVDEKKGLFELFEGFLRIVACRQRTELQTEQHTGQEKHDSYRDVFSLAHTGVG